MCMCFQLKDLIELNANPYRESTSGTRFKECDEFVVGIGGADFAPAQTS
jgi:hypothetical protein